MYAIYGNIYHQYTPNVSIYTSTMDPMGYISCVWTLWCQPVLAFHGRIYQDNLSGDADHCRCSLAPPATRRQLLGFEPRLLLYASMVPWRPHHPHLGKNGKQWSSTKHPSRCFCLGERPSWVTWSILGVLVLWGGAFEAVANERHFPLTVWPSQLRFGAVSSVFAGRIDRITALMDHELDQNPGKLAAWTAKRKIRTTYFDNLRYALQRMVQFLNGLV